MTDPVTQCKCGRPVKIKNSGQCGPCYSKEWRKTRKLQGGTRTTNYQAPDAGEWYDWAVVERALAGQELPRPLTDAEREHVAYRAIEAGLMHHPELLRKRLHMDARPALKLAQNIASGRVQVKGRSLLGAPTGWLPTPVPGV